MMKRIRTTLFLAALPMLASVPAVAADVAAGAVKVKEVCQACHGMNGNSTSPDYPRLGGQHEDYLVQALRDYKSGARKNPIMNGFAATLSEQDIENVAAYFASQPQVVFTKR
ncbi:MAG TPA: cytochrome c [Casimicrobiaceae bacterium]|jgi:cytochrome c553|nr:cytochrome c [Casimicrobiaceae bacterium]